MSRRAEPLLQRRTSNCPQCGTAVDPLHAARVRIFGERQYYFCSNACAEDFSLADDQEPRDGPRVSTPSHPATGPLATGSLKLAVAAPEQTPEQDPEDAASGKTEQTPTSSAAAGHAARSAVRRASVHPAAPSAAFGPGIAKRLLGLSAALGWLTVGLLLAEESALTTALRTALLALGNLALGGYCLFVERYSERRFALHGWLLSCVNLLLLLSVLAFSKQAPEPIVNFGATLLVATSTASLALRRLFGPIDGRRLALQAWLAQDATRVVGDQTERVGLGTLRPGEEIVVHAGETLVADATVLAGNAEVLPWFEATTVQRVGPEDFLYAGARLTSGQIRATVRWTGLDRHWERLTNDPARRADEHAPLVVLSKKIAYRGAPLLALAALATSLSAWNSWLEAALIALCGLSAFLAPTIDRWVAVHVAHSVLEGLKHGVVFRNAQALDAAGRVSTAVFCARGTLLLGEPELSSIEVTARLGEDEVLSLAAGAEQALQQHSAVALLRAARTRGVTPDAVRSPQNEPGLGVTAITASGETLVVGSRGLLLRERISMARAEARITELEALGRSVLLVAKGGHLVGLLALQDGLRTGARAAVQHLLDADIEPVLLSGDARKSCEALGRTIDIEHVRPEVLPAERGREIERLRAGGAQVAVIGRSPMDEVALSAASVSIALPSPGTPNLDHDIELATNEVQRAALALRLAHQSRARALRCLSLSAGGSAAIVLAATALSAPLAFVPLGCLGVTLLTAAGLAQARR